MTAVTGLFFQIHVGMAAHSVRGHLLKLSHTCQHDRPQWPQSLSYSFTYLLAWPLTVTAVTGLFFHIPTGMTDHSDRSQWLILLITFRPFTVVIGLFFLCTCRRDRSQWRQGSVVSRCKGKHPALPLGHQDHLQHFTLKHKGLKNSIIIQELQIYQKYRVFIKYCVFFHKMLWFFWTLSVLL